MNAPARENPSFVLAHHTIPGVGFEERVRAAATAGYDGIGLNFVGYRQYRDDGLSDDDMADVLASHGQRVLEIEALRGWSAQGEAKARSDRLLDLAGHLADRFDVPYLQAIGPYEGTLDQAAASFAALCDRAAEHGMMVGLEFIPHITNIADLATARQIAEGAARPNGGVCVDAWHFHRGRADWDALAAMPANLLLCIQIDDGTLVPEDPDYLSDTLSNRRAPGHGEFELERLIQVLDQVGCTAPVSVEVMNRDMQAMSAAAVATLTLQATRETLAKARDFGRSV